MHKRALSLALALSLLGSISVSVLASPNDDINRQKQKLSDQKKQLQNQKDELKNNKSSYEDVQAEVEKMNTSIEMLDSKIERLYRELDDTKTKVNKTKENIDKTQNEIVQAQQEIDDEQALFDKRMRSMYMNGVASTYVEVLLDSNGIRDFIDNIELLRNIAEYDKKIIADLKEKKAEIEKKKQKLEEEKANLLALQATQERKLEEVKDSKDEQQQLIADLERRKQIYASRISDYDKKIKESQKEIQRTLDLIDSMKDPAPTSPSRGNSSVSRSEMIKYSKQFLGQPYQWGGTRPYDGTYGSGFDCSGLVQYVYRKFGVNITRTTYTQIKEGKVVSRDELLPGDLVFFGTWGDPHHVGMYVGNGYYIHAPRTGDVIKISPLSGRRDYLVGRRYF